MSATMTEKRTAADYRAEMSTLADAVYAADRAWEADVASKVLGKAYRDAKAAYRAVEKEFLARFPDTVEDCHRCGGAGGSDSWKFTGWTCYECGGHGRMPYPNRAHRFPSSPAHRAKLMAKAAAKRAEEDAQYEEALKVLPEAVASALREADAAWEAFDRQYRGGYDGDYVAEPSSEVRFRATLAGKLRKYGSLTDGQVAAVERGLAKEAKEATRGPLVTGRREIEGEIVSIKSQPSRYGYGRSETKMLVVEDDGNKVWGTFPSALYGEHDTDAGYTVGANVGDRVRLTATVERSNDDPNFGFYSKPAKAEIVAQKITTKDGKGRGVH